MKLTVAATAASLLLLAGAAQAQAVRSPLYGELGYSFLRVENFGIKTNPQAIRGIVGYNFHPMFALEAMAAFGTRGDDNGSTNIKMRDAFGIYAKPKYDFNNIEAYARLGFTQTQVRSNFAGRSTTDHDGDFSWGIGANYNVNPKMYVGADWMRYTHVDHIKVEGFTISVGYRF